jgi:hypothetical protein
LFTIELTIVEGPEEGGRYEFQQGEVILGSDFTCDLILVHPDVSPQHVRIVDEKDEIYIEDLTGKEETKLNGAFVSREPLHNGDELQIGPYVFHITLEIDTARYEQGSTEHDEGFRERILRAAKRPPVLAVIILLGIMAIYWGTGFITSEESKQDLSTLGPVPLPGKGIYGCKVEGKPYVDKVEFTFLGKRPKYRIQYYPGYINRPGTVQIFINEQLIASVPPTIDRWSDEAVSVEIPERSYQMGETNIIRFDNKKNPPGRTQWGVRDVSVVEVPIPKCDIEVAQKYLTLASEKYDEREISEGNLYDAIKYLKKGQEYVIACEGSEVKTVLAETQKLYSDQLKEQYEKYMFNTKKFLKLKDARSASLELERVMRYIPDESDPRHRRAKDLFEKLQKVVR